MKSLSIVAKVKVTAIIATVVALSFLFVRRPEIVIVGRWTRPTGALRDFELFRDGHASVYAPALGPGGWDLHSHVLRISLNNGRNIALPVLNVDSQTLRTLGSTQSKITYTRVR